jgi:hypothetical protein
MILPGCTISGGRKGRRRALQRRVISDCETSIVRHILCLAVFQVARHNSKQVGYLLLAALMRDEPAVLDPVGETHARLQSRTASFLWQPPTKSDSWRRASP